VLSRTPSRLSAWRGRKERRMRRMPRLQ
jgi:hypothetical protein